jgi:NAD(P)-dependent dehydrogenase (short-subunit alcohol dehydrogenase family)
MSFFQGKTAIVTGAGSGIGRALALALAEAGARVVVVTDIVQERIDSVLGELERKGVKAGGYRVDHSKLADVQGFAEKFFSEWGHVDVLCSNAGVGHGGRFQDIPIDDWEWVLGINLWGTIYMMHVFVPRMIERSQGSILLTASAAGLSPVAAGSPYNTSKSAVVALGTTLRMELAEHNIKVSLLCPGFINTNIVKDGRFPLYGSSGNSAKAELEKFYITKGVDPAIVARHGLRAMERDKAIVLSPWSHSGLQYLLYRFSPGLYLRLSQLLLKTGIIDKMLGVNK